MLRRDQCHVGCYLRPFVQATNAIISVLMVSLIWGNEGLAILGAHEQLHSEHPPCAPPILLCIDIVLTRLSLHVTAVSWDWLKSIVASAGFDWLATERKDMRTCKVEPLAAAGASDVAHLDIGVDWFPSLICPAAQRPG